MPDVYRRNGLLAGANAIEPVAVLIIAFVKVNFVRSDDSIENFGIACDERLYLALFGTGICRGDEFITRDEDPSLCSVELDPVRIVA